MLGISELDWPRVLYTRTAAYLLGLAAVLSSSAVIINHSNFNFDALSPLRQKELSILGAASALGFVALLVCMGFFWLRCDASSKLSKTIWFLILLIGFPFGSTILYYVAVYLPALRNEPQSEAPHEGGFHLAETADNRSRLGPFRRILLVIWGFVVLPVFLVLSLPGISSLFAGIAAVVFCVWSAVVVLEAVFRSILSLYRSGMTHSAKPERPDSSRIKSRD
jgi:NADH:ubiquinone oxidoreductase subunit 3 (subunit A)